ncbi:MAG: hypothetical protein QOF37_285 [Thermoleophilaceae bacterium]|jgi:hypothetical protein|nr:hypothetical protein [Thermoleophilaceae bacterium]
MTASQPQIPTSQDAAIVLALAETAVPFSTCREDEAERWVRVLRMHGQVGGALQALGVGEAPLETIADTPSACTPRQQGTNSVTEVARAADRFAFARRARLVGTVDVLFGVFEVYGSAFDRALYVRGASREELIERLAAEAQPAAI